MVQSSHGMLTQHRNGRGQIGFEFANAGSIDQGRQRVAYRKIKIRLKNSPNLHYLINTKGK